MLIIPIKNDENIDKALKNFKKRFEKTGILREIRERQQYVKPSVKRRNEILRAIYIRKLREQLEEQQVSSSSGYKSNK